MMLLRARANNIQSFAYIWLHKGNQNEFLKHPKIKWLGLAHIWHAHSNHIFISVVVCIKKVYFDKTKNALKSF